MSSAGKIFICSTPIGNSNDCSKRLVHTLKSVDFIYAEDTRVTSKLLSILEIKSSVKRLDQNTMNSQAINVIEQAKAGKNIAYCTDAGMPGVSDPGLQLVYLARYNKVEVEVLPGPSAAVNAYVLSGFDNPNFYFTGFLPKKDGEKLSYLKKLKNIDGVIIIYESPNRLLSCLEQISSVFQQEQVSVCRELTKIHEEIQIGSATELLELFKNRDSIKGEIVICINNHADDVNYDLQKVQEFAEFLISLGLKTGDISKALCKAFGINKNQAYDIALKKK